MLHSSPAANQSDIKDSKSERRPILLPSRRRSSRSRSRERTASDAPRSNKRSPSPKRSQAYSQNQTTVQHESDILFIPAPKTLTELHDLLKGVKSEILMASTCISRKHAYILTVIIDTISKFPKNQDVEKKKLLIEIFSLMCRPNPNDYSVPLEEQKIITKLIPQLIPLIQTNTFDETLNILTILAKIKNFGNAWTITTRFYDALIENIKYQQQNINPNSHSIESITQLCEAIANIGIYGFHAHFTAPEDAKIALHITQLLVGYLNHFNKY